MKIYEIKSLNCKSKENRKILLKEVMKVLKLEEKPSNDDLKKTCRKIRIRYGFQYSMFEVEDKIQLNINLERDSYSVVECNTKYEAMCKYILICKAWLKYLKLKPNEEE